jgi:hypothetical protein
VLVVAVLGLASLSAAGTIVTLPPGLAPGSEYRLVFVTAGRYVATSSDIGVYNNDVSSAANGIPVLAALGATWLDIGSTATVNAIDNVGKDSGVPIYDLEGNLVANDAGTQSGGLFGGGLLSPILHDENGTSPSNHVVWTGTEADGIAHHPLGVTQITVGTVGMSGGQWLDSGDAIELLGASYQLYGISGILTAPGESAPEPSTTGMAILGGALAFFARKRISRAQRLQS